MNQRRSDERDDDLTWEVAEVAHPTVAARSTTPQHVTAALAPLVEARLDLGRAARKGIPEVVLAETKRNDQLVAIVRAFLDRNGLALVSRARPGQLDLLAREFPDAHMELRESARAAALHAPRYQRPHTGGHVGILTAGAGDIPIAEEARLVAEEMGCRVTTIYDVGVAGIHRLFGQPRISQALP